MSPSSADTPNCTTISTTISITIITIIIISIDHHQSTKPTHTPKHTHNTKTQKNKKREEDSPDSFSLAWHTRRHHFTFPPRFSLFFLSSCSCSVCTLISISIAIYLLLLLFRNMRKPPQRDHFGARVRDSVVPRSCHRGVCVCVGVAVCGSSL
jgi:hypothetical protein